MTDERLKEIEERLRWRAVDWRAHLGCDGGIYDREAFFEGAIEDLLAEVKRLREQLERLQSIVDACSARHDA